MYREVLPIADPIFCAATAGERSERRIGEPKGAIATAGPSAGAAGASPVLPIDSPEVEDVHGECSCQRGYGWEPSGCPPSENSWTHGARPAVRMFPSGVHPGETIPDAHGAASTVHGCIPRHQLVVCGPRVVPDRSGGPHPTNPLGCRVVRGGLVGGCASDNRTNRRGDDRKTDRRYQADDCGGPVFEGKRWARWVG